MYHKALISWKAGLHIGAVFRCPLSRLRLNALLLPFIIAYASGQEVTEAKLKGMDFFRPPEYAADPGNWLHGGDPRGSFDQAFGRFIGITGDLAFIGDLFTEDALAYSLSRREIVNKFDLVGTRGFAVSPQSFLYTATEVQGLGFTETTFNFIDTETALTRSILVDAGFSIPIGFGLHVFDDYWADFRFRFLTARDLAREGEILWQLESEGDEEFLAMAGFGYSIFVVVGHPDLIFDTRLECYDLRTGEKRWDYEYTRGGAVTLSAGFGRAVISSMDAFLVIDAATGGLAGTMPAGNFGRSGLPFAGSAAIGSQFIAVQTTSAPATSPTSPGIALYSLNELDHLLDIPNPWLVVGDATPNTFASEMAIQGPRILANFESPAEQQPNPVYDIELELSVGGGTFGPGDRFIYLGTQNFETNENDRLSALLLLSQPADVPVSATITPVALSGHDAATAGADFPVQPQVVVIPPGKTFTTFEIPVIDDAEREDLERFKIELSNPQNARLFTEGAIVTLSSDDFDPLTELVPLSEVPVEDFSDGGARDIAVGESFIIAAKSSGGEGNGLLAFDPYTRELRIDVDAPVAGEDFGASVDIHGDLAIAGAPRAVSGDGRAYLVDLSDGTILDTLENPDASNAPNFGQRVRLHGDYAVVGADQAGTVFVFERDGDSFSFLRQLDSPRTTTTFGETFDLNATQVAVSSYSGNAIDINDPDDPYFEARIFLYDLASGTLELTIEGERPLGRYALSLEGEELLAARGDVIERFTLPGTSVVESYEQPAERWNAIGFNGAFGAFTANLGGTLFWRDFARDVEGSAILGSGIQYFGHGSVVDGRGEPAIITGASTGARVFGAAASSDILVTTFSDQGDRPLVYQIPSEYGVSVSGGSFDEGAENASIRFSLTQPAPETVEVFFETVEDSAKAGTDFTATRGSVTIPTDSTEATAEIPILDNGNFDGPRRFYVTILGARNASIGDLISSVFITDNEVIDPPLISIEERATVLEGSNASIFLRVPEAPDFPVSVNYAISSNEVTEGVDYAGPSIGRDSLFQSELFVYSGTAVIQPGFNFTSIGLETLDDEIEEMPEDISIRYLSATNGQLPAKRETTLTILDNDLDPGEEIFSNVETEVALFGEDVAIWNNLGVAGAVGAVAAREAEPDFEEYIGVFAADDPAAGATPIYHPEPSIAAGGLFGKAVDVGYGFILASDPASNVFASGGGVAYVFDELGSLEYRLELSDGIGTDFAFGTDLALASHDGTTVAIVGAPGDDGGKGSVTIFDLADNTQIRQFTLGGQPGQIGGSRFANGSLATHGPLLAIGNPQAENVRVYDWTNGSLVLEVGPVDEEAQGADFGWSVALSDSYLAVGAPNDSDPFNNGDGAVEVFQLSDGSHIGSQTATSRLQKFGWSVALTDELLIVGNQNQVRLFDPTTVTSVGSLDTTGISDDDDFGWSVAIDPITGSRVFGAPNRDNPAVTTDQTNAAGSVFVTLGLPTNSALSFSVAAWSDSEEEGLLDIFNENGPLFGPLAIDRVIAYALGLEADDDRNFTTSALPQLVQSSDDGLPKFSFLLPRFTPVEVIYRVEQTSDLSDWDVLATKTGGASWVAEDNVIVRPYDDRHVRVTFTLQEPPMADLPVLVRLVIDER